MAAEINEDGIRLQYPENWQLDRQDNETGWTITLQSPLTAFFMISFDADLPDTEEMAKAAVEALREEYPLLEAEERVDTIAGQPAIGYDLSFISLDLTNTGWARSFYSSGGSVLLYWQTTDLELEDVQPVLDAIRTSVQLEDE